MSLLRQRFLRSIVGTCQRYLNVTTVRPTVHNVTDQTESVFWVPEKLGGVIIGKGGKTITDIKLKTKSRIYVDYNSAKDGEIPVTLTGTADTCAEAREIIEQLLARNAARNSETTIWVPEEKMGHIIGKKGAKINAIRQDTGTLISLDKDSMKDGQVPLIIKGQPEKCTEAKETIERLLANNSETTIWVPEAKMGTIIGKGGAKINTIHQDTGTFISFDKDSMKDGLVPLIIEGQPEKCTDAKETIERLVANNSEPAIWVPETKTGIIIGKGGAKINALQQDTGTLMFLDRDSMKDGLVPLIIKGQPGKCADAKKTIERLLANYSETTMWVPETKIGEIIGNRGAMLITIQQDTGAFIYLDTDLMRDGLVPVTIKGQIDECDAALAALTKIADKEMIE